MKIQHNHAFIRRKNGRRFAIVISLLILGINSCDNDDSEKTPEPGPVCRISRMNTSLERPVSATVASLTLTSTQYSYDVNNNQIASVYDYKHELTGGKAETVKVVTSNTYDNDGMLLSRVTESNSKDIDDVDAFVKITADYTYSNKLLTRVETEEVQNGNTQTTIITYEYNGDGKVTKYAVSDGSYKTIEYNGKAISKITLTAKNGDLLIRTYQFNVNGFLTGVVESGSEEKEYKYEFDDFGQVTRGEVYVNGQRHHAFTQTYDTKKSAQELMMPEIKGQPYIPDTYPEVINNNNLTKLQFFLPSEDFSDWVLSGSDEHYYEYTFDDYPIKRLSGLNGNGENAGEVALYIIKCN